MFAGPKKIHPEDQRPRAEARAKPDISFSPLAMPMLSGPGSIAVTIGLASLAKHWTDYAAIVAGIMIVAAISHVVLSLSGRIVGIIGAKGMHALTKIMGFLLLCIGPQFIVTGKQACIAINARSDLVIVARSKMDVAHDPLRFAANDDAGLGMGLQSLHAIHHLHAHGFELF